MSGSVCVDRQLCLNANYKKMACRRCVEACPAGCLSDDLVVDAAECSECGLCLAACPVEALAGENFPCTPLESLLADSDEPAALSCRRRREDSPWPCLGFIDGRLLLTLVTSGKGSGRKVSLDTAACAACRPAVAVRLDEAVAEANRLLLLAGKELVSQGDGAGVARTPKPISRRAFFAAMLGATIDTVREVVAAGAGGNERMPRQAWFTRHVASGEFASETPSPIFPGLSIAEACQACGLCIRICPHGALTAQDHGVALDFYHHPGRCTGCGLCAAHCPNAALAVTKAGRPDTYLVARRELPRCAECGQVYQPVGNNPVCIECLLNKTSRNILPAEEVQEETQ
jgi:ferredoxin